jgi:hypothetical protein
MPGSRGGARDEWRSVPCRPRLGVSESELIDGTDRVGGGHLPGCPARDPVRHWADAAVAQAVEQPAVPTWWSRQPVCGIRSLLPLGRQPSRHPGRKPATFGFADRCGTCRWAVRRRNARRCGPRGRRGRSTRGRRSRHRRRGGAVRSWGGRVHRVGEPCRCPRRDERRRRRGSGAEQQPGRARRRRQVRRRRQGNGHRRGRHRSRGERLWRRRQRNGHRRPWHRRERGRLRRRRHGNGPRRGWHRHPGRAASASSADEPGAAASA